MGGRLSRPSWAAFYVLVLSAIDIAVRHIGIMVPILWLGAVPLCMFTLIDIKNCRERKKLSNPSVFESVILIGILSVLMLVVCGFDSFLAAYVGSRIVAYTIGTVLISAGTFVGIYSLYRLLC